MVDHSSIEIELTKSQQKVAKHDFFRSFAPIPDQQKDIELYAEVAGRKFRDMFPDIADKIEEAKKSKRPIYIRGMPLGYIPSYKDNDGMQYFKNGNIKGKSLGQKPSSSIVLNLAIANLLGFEPSSNPGRGDYLVNNSTGDLDIEHDHIEWSLVIGIRGNEGAKTRFFKSAGSKEVSAEYTLNRGDFLLIPPHLYHDVTWFTPKKLGERELPRQTLVTLPEASKKIFSDEEIKAAQEKFLIKPGISLR